MTGEEGNPNSALMGLLLPAASAASSACAVLGAPFRQAPSVATSPNAGANREWGRLLGRKAERERLDRLLTAVCAGGSEVLVVRGEEGVGKTALLGHLLGSASGCRTSRVAGIESEMGPAFAGLRQVCAPFLDRLDRLASPQREALRTMFGFRPGEVPDLLFVGLAALSLLSDAAEERPLVCVVDDAQWLDQPSAQALAFMSRRLQAESIAMVFAVRDSGYEHEFAGLKELAVSGLSHDDAATLLASVVSGPIDERLRDRVIAEARGNPRALLNFYLGLAPAGFGIPETTPLFALRQGTL